MKIYLVGMFLIEFLDWVRMPNIVISNTYLSITTIMTLYLTLFSGSCSPVVVSGEEIRATQTSLTIILHL